ncbi:MAG: SPOR domain-containing protein [Sphingomonadales bacterium]|nr:SPOR domain-containing protein [Sphingomonadales bacterium]
MTAGYMVQVAAVSSADRARMLARSIGGTISAGPPVWRVRLGPYPDLASAERAKAEMARRGHPDATIIRFP